MPSALRRQTLSGRSAALLAFIAALSIFLAYAPTAHAQSSDATLRALTISAGTLTPDFAPGTTKYTAVVTNSVRSVTVTPTASDSNATIRVRMRDGNVVLNSGDTSPARLLGVGPTAIPIQVTAQDGSRKTYTVTVNRAPANASSDATLRTLTISGAALTPTFDSDTTDYTTVVANSVRSVTVTAATNHGGATITVAGTAVNNNAASAAQILVVGVNTIRIVVTAHDLLTTETYIVRVRRLASNDATLSNLTISAGALTPDFAPGTLAYTAQVANSVSSVTLTPTANHGGASITVAGATVNSGDASGAQNLNVGNNIIRITVIAEDPNATSRIYTVTVRRAAASASTDATLSGLTISPGTLNETFASGTEDYTASVSYSVSSVTVTPTASDSNATITVAGTAVNSGDASGAQALSVGANDIEIIVTAANAVHRKSYTVTVTRASASASTDATLSGLTISDGTLIPTFISSTTEYSVSVANSVSYVTVTPTANDSNATIKMRSPSFGADRTVTSGLASPNRYLVVGLNTVRIIVTAEDGATTKTYDVKVTRAGSSDATLSGLTISDGTLIPTFVSGTTEYTVSVANSVSSVTVTPTASHDEAIIEVDRTEVYSGSASDAQALSVGDTDIVIVVTAEDGSTTETYTVKVTRAASASTDATLSRLIITDGAKTLKLTPSFASNTEDYTASVAHSVTSVHVIPYANQAGATIAFSSGSFVQAVIVGPNAIDIIVTAEDRTTRKTYTVVVTRASASASTDATLSGLSISEGTMNPSFDSNTEAYTAEVAHSVSSVTVTPTAKDSNATITVAGTTVNSRDVSAGQTVNSGAASGPQTLTVGDNYINILVTAEDGATTKTYFVWVPRDAPSNDAKLRGLSISVGTLTPSFDSNTDAYTALVAHSVSSVTVTPTAKDSNATITVAGTAVNSGDASGAQTLSLGDNDIVIVVTAEDGSTTETYTVKVTRRAVASICSVNPGIQPSSQPYLLADCEILLGLKDTLVGSGTKLNWAANVNINSWYGIAVSGGRVQWIDLSSSNLGGSIPPELGDLTELRYLELYDNWLSGRIPPELGDLENLIELRLDYNGLTGAIPSELSGMSNLQYLYLDSNGLTGPIPSELSGMTELRELRLHRNRLSGAIPPGMGGLRELEELYLGRNRLGGAIPVGLSYLENLKKLHLQCNELTGVIPNRFALIDSVLTEIWLHGNPMDSPVVIPTGLTPSKVRLSGAEGVWDYNDWCGPPEFPSTETGQRSTTEGPPGRNVGAPVTAIDPDNLLAPNAQPLTYTLSGTDAAHFTINSATGQLKNTSILDYEDPVDADTNNAYEVKVMVSDGLDISTGSWDRIDVTITVTDVADATPTPAPTSAPGSVKMGDDDDYEPEWGGIKGAATAGSGGVTLNWRAPTAGGTVKGYRILRREVGITSYVEIHDTLGDTDPTATTYLDPHSSAESGKDYMYRVKAVGTDCRVAPDWYAGDGRGWSDPKNFGRATVQTHSTALSVPSAPAAAPAAPQMGNGTDAAGSNNGKDGGAVASSSGITVTWMAPTTTGNASVKGYVILRREEGNRQDSETAPSRHLAGSEHKYREIHTTLGDTDPTALSYLDPASVLAGGTTYLYRVRAINNNCYISPDPTRHDQTGYSFGDNNFGKATAQ